MLYSIGKDSSVMLHLAQKAFFPSKPPFPLLHVDTTWKFREMIAFRDEAAKRAGMELLVHVNKEGLKRGISPIASGSSVHTQVMKTEGLRQTLDLYHFDVAFFLVAPRAAKSRIEMIKIKRLEQPLGLHHLRVHRGARGNRRDAAFQSLLVDMHEQFHARPFRGLIAKSDHLAEFPGCIDMQQRKRRL